MKKLITFIAAAMISSPLFAQIPNNGFETWTTVSGHDNPTGWDNLNGMAMPMSASMFTCMKGTPGNPGASYMQLISKTMMGNVVPGIAICGVMDTATHMPKSGFACTTRPVSFTGSWQYMAYGSDQGHMNVLLCKWNSSTNMRDTVAFCNYALPGMVMSWGTFTIPLIYRSGAIPDSAIIVLAASGATPVNNSYLYVDNLAFTGTVPAGVTNVNPVIVSSVYPNPTKATTKIAYTSENGTDMHITISDMNGRVVSNIVNKSAIGANNYQFNASALPKGFYIIKLTDGTAIQFEKLIVE